MTHALTTHRSVTFLESQALDHAPCYEDRLSDSPVSCRSSSSRVFASSAKIVTTPLDSDVELAMLSDANETNLIAQLPPVTVDGEPSARSGTVASECSIVDHGLDNATPPAGYVAAVESVAAVGRPVRELLRDGALAVEG